MKKMGSMRYLPDELLENIRKRLDTSTKIDVCRFRAVCRLWRSTIPPFDQKRLRFPIRLRFSPPITGSGSNTLTLSKSVVYHLQPPPPAITGGSGTSSSSSNSQYSRGWVSKVKQGKLGKTHLLHPLSSYPLKKLLPKSFPKVLNLLDFRVFELANALHLISNNSSISSHRVAMSSNSDCPALMFVAFGKLFHYKLRVNNSTGNWTQIHATISEYHYQDVTLYQGKFYAVDQNGRTVVVDSSLHPTTIASSVDDGHFHRKYFVESLGELLLVDKLYYYEGFKVYKLNAIEKQWVEMKTLGDRILFVGDDCCFSASAQDFLGSQGNCIYFTYSEHDTKELSQIEVFNLGDGSSSLLDLYHPGSANIFLPTPNLA